MASYMLDTNIVSHILRRHPAVLDNLSRVPVGSVCMSAITEGELLYGLARRPSTSRTNAVQALLARVEVLPWSRDVAARYGPLRAEQEKRGLPLGPLDTQIAAHALASGCVLVTADQAFAHVQALTVVDWTD